MAITRTFEITCTCGNKFDRSFVCEANEPIKQTVPCPACGLSILVEKAPKVTGTETRVPFQPLGNFVPHILQAHRGSIEAIAFSPDGSVLASGGHDRVVCLRGLPGGEVIRDLGKHDRGVSSVCFSPDGRFLASGGYDGTVRLWSVADGELLQSALANPEGLTEPDKLAIHCIQFSPDGRYLAVAGRTPSVRILKHEDGSLFEGHSMLHHDHWILSVTFTPDGTLLASGSGDLVRVVGFGANVLELEKLDPRLLDGIAFKGHGSTVMGVAFNPNGSILASCSQDKSAKLWQVPSGKPLHTLDTGTSEGVAFSPDGGVLATASWRGVVQLWNVNDGSLIRQLFVPSSGGNPTSQWVHAVAFSPDSRYLAAANEGGTIAIWSHV